MSPETEPANRLMTVAEVAVKLGVSRQFVRDEIRAGVLQARQRRRPSGRTLIRIPEPEFVKYWAEVWSSR